MGCTRFYLRLSIATLIYLPYYRQLSEEFIVKNASSNSHFMETLYGLATVKALGVLPQHVGQWFNLNIDAANASIRQQKLDMMFSGTNALMGACGQIIVLWLSAVMIINENKQ